MRLIYDPKGPFNHATFFAWCKEHLHIQVVYEDDFIVTKKRLKREERHVKFKLRPEKKERVLRTGRVKEELTGKSAALAQTNLFLLRPDAGTMREIMRYAINTERIYANDQASDSFDEDGFRVDLEVMQEHQLHCQNNLAEEALDRARKSGSICASGFFAFMEALFVFESEDVQLSTNLGMLCAKRNTSSGNCFHSPDLMANDLQKIIRRPMGKKEWSIVRPLLLSWMEHGSNAFHLYPIELAPKLHCECMRRDNTPCDYRRAIECNRTEDQEAAGKRKWGELRRSYLGIQELSEERALEIKRQYEEALFE